MANQPQYATAGRVTPLVLSTAGGALALVSTSTPTLTDVGLYELAAPLTGGSCRVNRVIAWRWGSAPVGLAPNVARFYLSDGVSVWFYKDVQLLRGTFASPSLPTGSVSVATPNLVLPPGYSLRVGLLVVEVAPENQVVTFLPFLEDIV